MRTAIIVVRLSLALIVSRVIARDGDTQQTGGIVRRSFFALRGGGVHGETDTERTSCLIIKATDVFLSPTASHDLIFLSERGR